MSEANEWEALYDLYTKNAVSLSDGVLQKALDEVSLTITEFTDAMAWVLKIHRVLSHEKEARANDANR